MSSAIVARYDRHARLYEEHWAPVIRPAALGILDVAAAWLPDEGNGATILDVGAGTGTLSRAAARRWPAAQVVALDPSVEMLAMAADHLRRDDALRATVVVGSADAIPLPAGTVDVAVSSFVLQLVPDRPAALREIRRVLRPGGALAYVTWLDRGEPFAPHEAFDEAVLDLGVEEPEEPEEPRAGDLVSPGAAAAQLRRAGFVRSGARVATLRHAWTPDSYLAYKLECDEWALVGSLSRADRARLERLARRRLAALPDATYVWEAEVVMAWARVSSTDTATAPAAVSRPAGSRPRAARSARGRRPRCRAG